jgi:dipeptidase
MNECGVAIGNEAVFTKETLSDRGLLGMDLVRLGLERGRTARHALDAIIGLIEEFGQGGSAFEHYQWQYSNSFIIADPCEAYILETSGSQYAWKKVSKTASISNHIAIGADWDALSPDAREHAVLNGWWGGGPSEKMSFSAAYRSAEAAPPQISEERLSQSQKLLEENRGRISPLSMMRILRDHYETGTVFTPGRDPSDGKCYSICMHAEPVGTTAASIVAHLGGTGRPMAYWASFGPPCCSMFIPLYVEGKIPLALTRAGARFSEDSVWWLFKRLGDSVAQDFAGRTPRVQGVWNGLETEFALNSAEIEAEAEMLRSRGETEQVSSFLSRFMDDTLDKVLIRLRDLTAELAS